MQLLLLWPKWTNLQNVSYMYCPWTQNPADTLPSNTSNLPNTLIAANLEGTILTFGGLEDALLALFVYSVRALIGTG